MNALDLRFPLDKTALPKLRIDAATVSAWTRTAKAEIAGVIQNRDSWYFRGDELTGAYKLVLEHESLRGFARTTPHTPDKHEFLCRGNLQLALDDVALALQSETTFAFRSGQVQLYQDTFLDAAVLHVADRASADAPCRFAGVKWAAYSSPGAALVSPRDYVYFEYLVRTRDADGRPVVVQYIDSPELQADAIEQPHGLGLTRARMAAIHTFRTDVALGGTFYQAAGSLQPGKSMPAWAVTKTLVQQFKSMLQLSGLADARAIAALGVLKTLPAAPSGGSSATKRCNVCEKKFHVLTRVRIACRACGRCACRSCIVALKFFNETSLFGTALPVLSERFCLTCVMNAREQRREGGTLARSNDSINSNRNSVGPVSIASDSTTSSMCSSDELRVTSVSSEFLQRNTVAVASVMRTTTPTTDAIAAAAAAAAVGPPLLTSRSVSEGTQRNRSTSKPPQQQRVATLSPASPVAMPSARAATVPTTEQPTAPSRSEPPQAAATPTTTASYTTTRGPSRMSSARCSAVDADAFTKMSESIAAQSALLMQLQNSMSLGTSTPMSSRYNFASPPISPCNGSVHSDSDDRFEILI